MEITYQNLVDLSTLGGIIFLLIAVVATHLARQLHLWRRLTDRRHRTYDSAQNSILLSYFTVGHGLTSGKRGKINDMRYALYITLPVGPNAGSDFTYTKDGALLYTLDLPFSTNVHLVGVSTSYKMDRIKFEAFLKANGMEPVHLEGNFSKYFSLYATKGQQAQVRYVLDPEAMSFILDYCRSHFWEINAANLYIAAASPQAGTENLLEDSQRFAEQIKPALISKEAGPVKHALPYGEYDDTPLPCPICQVQMAVTETHQACPEGHGILISGRHLIPLRGGKLTIRLANISPVDHGQLTCPNCKNTMTATAYLGGPVEIDSCGHCPFRWLDANEIEKVVAVDI